MANPYFLKFDCDLTIRPDLQEFTTALSEGIPASIDYTIYASSLTFATLFNGLKHTVSNSDPIDFIINSNTMFTQANDTIIFEWNDSSGTPKTITFTLNLADLSVSPDTTNNLQSFLDKIGTNIDNQLALAVNIKQGNNIIELSTSKTYNNSMKYISVQSHPSSTNSYISYLKTNFIKQQEAVCKAITLGDSKTVGKSFATYFTANTDKFYLMIKHIIVNSALPTDKIDLYVSTLFDYGTGVLARDAGELNSPRIMIKFQSVAPVVTPVVTPVVPMTKEQISEIFEYLPEHSLSMLAANSDGSDVSQRFVTLEEAYKYTQVNDLTWSGITYNIREKIYTLRKLSNGVSNPNENSWKLKLK